MRLFELFFFSGFPDEQGVEYTDYDDQTYYVERLNDVTPERIFGMTWDQLNAKQRRQ